MNDERDTTSWPPEAGDPGRLPQEREPPRELEDRVTGELLRRGAISPSAGARRLHPAWAIAASVTLLVVGYLAGRFADAPQSGAAAFPETADYALLLFETPGYDAPADPAERLERYNEYGRWVAEARARGQFVTGEDLAVDRGWIVEPAGGPAGGPAEGRAEGAEGPGGDAPRTRPGVAVGSASALSGMFLIKATDDEQALALARRLPHVRHGGQVVVQRTIPTDRPPAVAGAVLPPIDP